MNILPYIDGLHVLPWLTDGAVNFLDCYIFHLKQTIGKNPMVFEFGGGGSTLYFLSRGCFVTTVDHEREWVVKIQAIATALGHEDRLTLRGENRPYDCAINKSTEDFDIILIDGRDRVKCLETVIGQFPMRFSSSILVLDNTERVNDQYSDYLPLLENHKLIHFEQPFVLGAIVTQAETIIGLDIKNRMPTNGLAAGVHRDRSGNCNKGRSITSIAIPKAMGEFTSQGVPLISNSYLGVVN